MMRTPFHHRPGVTFIELLLFLAIISIVGVLIMPLLFASTENRLLQESIALVEHNGTIILQTFGRNARHAERIIAPAIGAKSTVVALQTSSGGTNPTIMGINSGAFVVVKGLERTVISSPQVAVQDFRIRNTSTSTDRQSVTVSFTVSRTIRLSAPRQYQQRFEGLFTLYPVDVLQGDACSCATPGCIDSQNYSWQVCVSGSCENAATELVCE